MSKSNRAADTTGRSSDYVRSVKTINRMLREMRTGQWLEASNEPIPVKIMGRPAPEAASKKTK
jgi:hypothetical protein